MIHDYQGVLVAVKNGGLNGPLEALATEALGCKEALVWLQENDMQNVTVESYSIFLVKEANASSFYNSYVGLIVRDCKCLLDGLRGCSIAHVHRSANQVAHCLTKVSVSKFGLGEWRDYLPLFLSNVLALDFQ